MSWNIGQQVNSAPTGSTENPDKIDIADLAEPVLTDLQKQTMAWADANPVSLTEKALLEAARQATGLSDFGDQGFRQHMAKWIESTDADTELSALGRIGVFGAMLRNLTVRLRIEDMVRRFPEILDIEIDRPIIIAGLPRSGTTYLQNFLGADPRLRALPYWEAIRPVPGPEERCMYGEEDPRRARCAADWAQQDALLPYVKAIHEFAPDHISEDIELQTPEFGSYHLDWLTHAVVWRDHYFQMDHRPVYRYLRKCLQVLTFLTGRKRWLLKCPQHMEQLSVVNEIFPDATIVINHRDPVASIQSAITGVAYSSRVTRTRVRPDRIAEYWIDRYERLLRACVRDRDALDPARTVDVYFHELMQFPMEIVGDIYAKADLPLGDGMRQWMTDALTHHPRGKNGQIVYDLRRDFKLEPDDIRRRFGFYFERFGVKAEVK
ncbi:sulfotransferase [Paraburkholderia phymatum]|uniref:sulfotransferase family protein n=1 Tax=Paraburkholderia phymatum TaxID=148447 RepID=UPI0031722F97